ncbi:hypothetical protein ABW19_dt0200416 [Dactylella cylindrospora]|nr:hypothetical protein ABW19_dt0200416 [Dactylella cylindrospora]
MIRSTTTATLSRHLRHHHLRINPSKPILLHPLLLTDPNGSFNRLNGHSPISSPRYSSTLSVITPTITTILDTTQSLILTLQTTTSLPWLFTIPLIALIVRTTITLPFTIFSHKRTNTALSLSPLISAWSHVYRKRVAAEIHPTAAGELLRGRKVYDTPEKWTKEVARRTRGKRKEVYARFGCQMWKGFVGLVQVPVWIAASMSVRRLTGVGDWWSPVDKERLPEVVRGSVGVVGDGKGVDGEVVEGAGGVLSEVAGVDGGSMGNRSLHPSDPPRPVTGWRKGLRNALMTMSILVIPITINSPAVLLLYWITSSSYSVVQNAVLGRYMTPPRRVEPVKDVIPSWIKRDTEEENRRK